MPIVNEPTLRPVATVVAETAGAQAMRGPETTRYIAVADRGGALFRFLLGSSATDDGRTALVVTGGGQGGAWIRQRENDRGADLGDADADLTVGGGAWRVLPAATLSLPRTLTLTTTNAAAGDRIAVTRLDATANAVSLINGGTGGGTLATLPPSTAAYVECQYDGADWCLRDAHALL